MPNAEITKRVIAEAMKQLMLEKPLAKISVGDIVGRCGINRNSFYYHFKDKFDLVNWIYYTEMATVMTRGDAQEHSVWILLESILDYLYQNKEFYTNALSVSGQNSFSEYFGQLLSASMRERSQDIFMESEDKEFYITFFVDSFLAAVIRWLREGAEIAPEKLTRLIINAVTGAGAVIEDGEWRTSMPDRK